jgi:hypothetical protein
MIVFAGNEHVEISDEHFDDLGLDADVSGKPILLGCGTQACAYSSSGGKDVVKFTRDWHDALTSWLVMNERSRKGWAIPIKGVYRLRRLPGTDNFDPYVIIAAFAKPISKEFGDDLNEVYDQAVSAGLGFCDWGDFRGDVTARLKDVEEAGDNTPEKLGRLRETLDIIDNAARGFQRVGMCWVDFHAGNWGMYRGKPVVIDLGMSRAEDEEPDIQLQMMDGPRSVRSVLREIPDI